MSITLPHIEDTDSTNYFPPQGEFETFQDDSDYEEKVREWGLSNTKEVKKEFWYKEATHQRLVTIKGYQIYGQSDNHYTLVIEFQDGNLSCIHPAYLKEMQSPSFGKILASAVGLEPQAAVEEKAPAQPKASKPAAAKKSEQKKAEKKDKPAKLDLPDDKVHFTGSVKQFALTWNNFNEENDEVVILENVIIEGDNPTEVGLAWCSHSKTLKKFELSPGDKLEFDGKIVKKKLPNGKDIEDEEMIIEDPVHYKINNPSKIKKS